MTIAERLPSMTDKELVNLAGNAQRLTASTNPNQREAAETLLPLVQAEQAVRADAKPAAIKRKAAAAKKAAAATASVAA